MVYHRAFISHAHADNETCRQYVDLLRARGFDIWYDETNLEGGRSLSYEIQRQLVLCSAFVVMLSSASVDSYWVQLETDAYRDLAAHDKSRIVLPVRITTCEVPLLLRGLKWIDAVNRPVRDVVTEIELALGIPLPVNSQPPQEPLTIDKKNLSRAVSTLTSDMQSSVEFVRDIDGPSSLAGTKNKQQSTLTAIDIGTTKIRILTAALAQGDVLDFLGGISIPLEQDVVRDGAVVQPKIAASSIVSALSRIAALTTPQVRSAFINLSGAQLQSFNTLGTVKIVPRESPVSIKDVSRVVDVAHAETSTVSRRTGRELIHVIPRQYMVDDLEGVPNPIGMSASQLSVQVLCVSGSKSYTNRLVEMSSAARLTIDDIIASPLAAAEAVLTPSERELGTMVLDIGGSTTDICIYIDGLPWYMTGVTYGGSKITRGVATELHVSLPMAEQLKLVYGRCGVADGAHDAQIYLEVDGRIIAEQDVWSIVDRQVREIIERVKDATRLVLKDEQRIHGIILTGGVAGLPGLAKLFETAFNLPTRIGQPALLRGMPSSAATAEMVVAHGLLLRGRMRHSRKGRQGRPLDLIAMIRSILGSVDK